MRFPILDRYLIKNLLIHYLFIGFIIVLIICMIDYTEKLDNFIKTHAPVKEIIFNYYFNLVPYWLNFISPLIVFIAAVFFTSRIAARTEIIAMLSTGISFGRIILPYFIGACVLAGITFISVGWILPKANKIRVAFEQKYLKDSYAYDGSNVHIKVAPNVYAYLKGYNIHSQTGDKFTLERVKGNTLVSKLSADRLVWNKAKKKWKVENYTIRNMDGSVQSMTTGASLDTTLNLFPKDFENNYNLFETFTLPELNDYIELLISRGSDGLEVYLIERYTRLMQPFAMLILTVIGVIVSARKSRRGVGWQIALGFSLAFIYILFFLLSKGVAQAGAFSPLFAVALPNIVFTIIGIILYKTLPR